MANNTMRKILFILFILFLSINNANATNWTSNNSLIDGLYIGGIIESSISMYYDTEFRAITGENLGTMSGYNYSTNWTLLYSMGNEVNGKSTPSVFKIGSTYYMISGSRQGDFYGFVWNGSAWISNSTIVNNLTAVPDYSIPFVYYYNNQLQLISGEFQGVFYGYIWNGTSWISDSSIVNGLPDIGRESAPAVFYDEGKYQLIAGNYTGEFVGYDWNGTSWISNISLINNITDVGDDAIPSIYILDDTVNLIIGNRSGYYTGYSKNAINITFWLCIGLCDTYAAKNGSDNITVPANFTITSATYIREEFPDTNYGTTASMNITGTSTNKNESILLDLGVEALTNTIDVYIYQESATGSENIASYSCSAFVESTVTWNTAPACTTYGTQIHTNTTGWTTLAFQNVRYVRLNASALNDAYVFASDGNGTYPPYVVHSEATEQNDCLSWATACLNISRAEALVSDYGTTHIGYGNYSAQPAMNGNMAKPIEYFCDSAGYQENVSEPWCDMPSVIAIIPGIYNVTNSTYVQEADPNTSYYSSWLDYINNNTGDSEITYYEIPNVDSTINLSLYNYHAVASNVTFNIYSVTITDYGSLTWNTRPSLGTLLSSYTITGGIQNKYINFSFPYSEDIALVQISPSSSSTYDSFSGIEYYPGESGLPYVEAPFVTVE